MTVETAEVLEARLLAFHEALEAHDYLEIDGDIEGDSLSTHQIKVLSHEKKAAYGVSLEAIMEQELKEVVVALETGIRNKLYGITRIVGYYSRISNWNKSKKAELVDRIRGRSKGGYFGQPENETLRQEAIRSVPHD